MVRQALAGPGVLMVLLALPMAPQAAADNGQMVLTQAGTLRCLVSADNRSRGGGPMVVCERTDGQEFAQAPFSAEKNSTRLNLAVVRGTGEFYWAKGTLSDSGQPLDLAQGQTYHIGGWTIRPEELRTRFTYDRTGHGIFANVQEVRQF